MNNKDLSIEIYKRLLEVGINASMASVSIIEEVLNEERERNLAPRATDGAMKKVYEEFYRFVKVAVMTSSSHEELSRLVTAKTIEVNERIE